MSRGFVYLIAFVDTAVKQKVFMQKIILKIVLKTLKPLFERHVEEKKKRLCFSHINK